MSWILICIAGLFEVAWAVGLKYTHGFTRLWPSVGTVLGIGAVGTVILGIVLFNDPANAPRLICVALIVAGILGLKLTSAA